MARGRLAIAWLVALGLAPQAFAQSEPAAQSSGPSDPAFEQPHEIPLSDVVPSALQSGPGYRLGDSVLADGFSCEFVVETEEFGSFTPTSEYMLAVRTGEVYALRELAEIRKSKAYAKAVAKAGVAPVYVAKNLVTRPVETATAVPKGIWRSGKKAVTWIGGDRRERAETENSATREAIGVSRSKRALAAKLYVDPYTTNIALQDELDRVSWASFAGGLTVSLAMAAAGLPPAASLTYRVSNLTKTTHEMVTSQSGGDLYRRNRRALEEMGFGTEEAEAFLNNPHLSPSRKTAITLALESLEGVGGLGHIVEMGTAIGNEDDAVRLQRTAELISVYHQTTQPVEAIVRFENHLFVKERSGNGTAVLPADRLLWTRHSRDLADAMKIASGPGAKLSVWTTGVVSDTARAAFEARGVVVREHIGPSYEQEVATPPAG